MLGAIMAILGRYKKGVVNWWNDRVEEGGALLLNKQGDRRAVE